MSPDQHNKNCTKSLYHTTVPSAPKGKPDHIERPQSETNRRNKEDEARRRAKKCIRGMLTKKKKKNGAHNSQEARPRSLLAENLAAAPY